MELSRDCLGRESWEYLGFTNEDELEIELEVLMQETSISSES